MTTSSVSHARALALVLAVVTVGGSLLVAVPTADAALTNFTVTPGLYSHPGLLRHPYVYVPSEVISFTLSGDTPGEQFDAVVLVRSTGQVLQGYDNVVMPSTLSLTLTYPVPTSLPDGDDYQIEVGNNQYIDSGRSILNRLRAPWRFAIQEYEVALEVNRPAYLGGDDVIATWSVNLLRGGALAPDGFGQLWVYDATGASLITPTVHGYTSASGTFAFKLPDLADPRFDGIAQTWFNDTTSNPVRFQERFTFFAIDSLGVIVNTNQPTYAPGGIVTTSVTTVVTTNQPAPSPFDPPEPGINVDISVWEIPAPPAAPIERTQYGATGLVTDAHGQLTYVFKLDASIADGTNFEVRAAAAHPNGIWRWQSQDTFTVSAAAGITQVLQFNKAEYQAGDTATVTSIVRGAGSATLTYIFEVRDSTTTPCSSVTPFGTLLAKSTQDSTFANPNKYSYGIDPNFQGQVCFRVTADDGQGNRVTSAQEFNVVFGWLLVNADPQQYNAGGTVTVSWELKSNRIDPALATYYYEVRDRDGNLVSSGTTGTVRQFRFSVPDPASSQYTFTVTATQAGRTVSGSITLGAVRGFFITVTFDRNPPAYSPGETIHLHYTISPRSSDSILPSTFRITYGLLNGGAGGSRVASTSKSSGDLTYTVPNGIDQGDELFSISEANTGTQAIETLTIRGTNPLQYVTLGDIPLFDVILLLLIVVILLMMWRKGFFGGMGMGTKAAEAPPAPSRMEPVHAPAGMPMTVTCRSCGSPIEITTSKRPIEVMCPKCGNTEMVA